MLLSLKFDEIEIKYCVCKWEQYFAIKDESTRNRTNKIHIQFVYTKMALSA